MKICTKCKLEKDESCFHRHTSTKDGLNTICKDCFKEYPKRAIKTRFSTIQGDTKRCNACNEFLSLDNFYFTKTGYAISTCKKCKSLIRKSKYTKKIPQPTIDGTRWCTHCKKFKNVEEFYRDRTICQNCLKIHYRRKTYGITEEEFNSMLETQNMECAICGGIRKIKEDTLCVDHCHKTNKVRGLLCNHCNTALGKFEDNIELLSRAIIYLNK